MHVLGEADMLSEEMSSYQNIHLWLVGVSAVASFLVAAMAIFGPTIRNLFLGPRLHLQANSHYPFIQITSEQRDSSSTSKKTTVEIRLRITNKGHTPATACTVLVEEVYYEAAGGSQLNLHKSFLPTAMPWASVSPPNTTSTCDLIPGVSSYLTIARIEQAEEPTQANSQTPALQRHHLHLMLKDSKESAAFYRITAATVVFPAIVYAQNYRKGRTYYIAITWQGTLPEEAAAPSKLSVRVLKKRDFLRRKGS
jgi:hypothetical protein